MPTALLVDDEPSASARLGDLLAAYGEIEVLGAVRSVEQAVAFIEGKVPDIVFLDVGMPGGSGLSLLEKLPAETEVCFVTAYSQYAVSAYDFGAVDYLVKPVDPDRLEVAVTRILRAFGSKTEAPAPDASDSLAKAPAATFVIPLRDGARRRSSAVTTSSGSREWEIIRASASSATVNRCSCAAASLTGRKISPRKISPGWGGRS